MISDSKSIYLRSTPIPRALESVQQAFWGMYPLKSRTADFSEPTILTRAPADETLYPNETNCRRFAQLSRAFAERAASRWNSSEDMDYLTKLIGKWMPPSSPRVAVDSHPRLSGIMDTINATAAHGPDTRLPREFYDTRGRDVIDRIAVEEWFAGYVESAEYRSLGIGALAGDIVTRMVRSVEGGSNDREGVRFALAGCHDTSLAGLLSSLGAFEGEQWPPYTSHVAIELFKKTSQDRESAQPAALGAANDGHSQSIATATSSLWQRLFDRSQPITSGLATGVSPIERRPMAMLSPAERDRLRGYYVRIRYNDRVMTVPGCKAAGKHLDGDQSFCTLVSSVSPL